MERKFSIFFTIAIPNVCFHFKIFGYLFYAELRVSVLLIQINKSEGHLEPVVLRYCEASAVESWDQC